MEPALAAVTLQTLLTFLNSRVSNHAKCDICSVFPTHYHTDGYNNSMLILRTSQILALNPFFCYDVQYGVIANIIFHLLNVHKLVLMYNRKVQPSYKM